MSVRNLEYLFRPKSVAVIGASTRPRSVGVTVMHNLLEGGFAGPIMPVNPRYDAVVGVLAYPDVSSLPKAPELAIICTPPLTIPKLIDDLGRRGTKAAIVLTAGLGAAQGSQGKSLQEEILVAAKTHQLRILGPNCVGLMVPPIGLNASFAHTHALPGKIAFVSQSGALTTAVLDWAKSQNIGFSHFISLGDSIDVDFGDVLDYLASDTDTQAILLYIEAIKATRKFMSAARAAARNKQVLAVKAGRAPEGAQAAASHTGALAGADSVYDAAIRRAGMLRVFTIEDLFNAVETLAKVKPKQGKRLTILTNGGGAGVMAADELALSGGRLAVLTETTLDKLNGVLPVTWSHGNPVDIIGDASVERYRETLEILLQDAQTDTILFIHAPTAIVPSDEIASAIVEVIKQGSRTVLTCWLGGDGVAEARRIVGDSGISTYDTPERAVKAFLQMVEYRRNQELLMETPVSIPTLFKPDTDKAKSVVQTVVADRRNMLTEPEAKAVLAAYGIPVVETRTAHTPEEAGAIAQAIGFPVAIKIFSPDVTHKSDVGGVVLDLDSVDEVTGAARAMADRLRKLNPKATLKGFSVEAMARRPHAFELIIGATTDPVFGPVIVFGQGGTAVEVIGDRTIGLPPLNTTLAWELIGRTNIAKLLAGYRNQPPANRDALVLALIQITQLVIDLPEIAELDINPLLADEHGVLALDARIRITPPSKEGQQRLAIRPYPQDLEEWISLDGQPVLLRPIRPEDEPQHSAFFKAVGPDDVRFRFFGLVREFPHSQLARYTQIDYDREMAFIATAEDERGHTETFGEVRAIMDPDNTRAEIAIVVRADLKGKGLGSRLLKKMIDYCRRRGLKEVLGEASISNQALLKVATELGFDASPMGHDDTVPLKLML
jgi:acetyltransferase